MKLPDGLPDDCWMLDCWIAGLRIAGLPDCHRIAGLPGLLKQKEGVVFKVPPGGMPSFYRIRKLH